MLHMALKALAWSGHYIVLPKWANYMSRHRVPLKNSNSTIKDLNYYPFAKQMWRWFQMFKSFKAAIPAWGHTTDVLYSARDNQLDEK